MSFSPDKGASRPIGVFPGFWMPGVDGFATIGRLVSALGFAGERFRII